MSDSNQREILLVLHPTRPEAKAEAIRIVESLQKSGFYFLSVTETGLSGVTTVNSAELSKHIPSIELALVLGGDGTILRGAEQIHGSSIPVLGINLGHVGFLAQIGRPTTDSIVSAIKNKNYSVEKRMTLAYQVQREDEIVAHGWALNEITVERNTETMIELFVQVDHRPLSRWGCDGVICATPTGSTAYAFSAGGPVVWPDVEALVLLPLAAHALFSDPMVVSPKSQIAIDLESEEGVLSADGLRKFKLVESDRILITSDKSFINLAHIEEVAFTDRLVAKFKLPVDGWRGE
ncbi:MAG: NAD kinase [Candidatus Nanopelagicaceae bacterium]|nr:NAD kinase [Candidatus Nanopelagicaceae bacterium]